MTFAAGLTLGLLLGSFFGGFVMAVLVANRLPED